ncbi:hypothetical protein NUM3379_36060 [Kineococcus sp. NUM-3379]
MTLLRPVLAVPLVFALTGAGATVAMPELTEHSHQKHLREAVEVARGLQAPFGAVDSTVCNGDGQVACWESPEPVKVVATKLARGMDVQADKAAAITCEQVPVGTTGAHLSADSCFVRVRFGSHGTFAFVEPLVERDDTGIASVVGTRISLSAA